jgi:hypothetical protein
MEQMEQMEQMERTERTEQTELDCQCKAITTPQPMPCTSLILHLASTTFQIFDNFNTYPTSAYASSKLGLLPTR